MSRLLRVELSRLVARRAVVLVLLGAAALAAVTFATTAWDTRPVSAADLAAAERTAAEEAEQPYVAESIAECEADPQDWGARDAADCAEQVTPRAEWFLDRAQLDLQAQRDSSGLGLATLLLGVAIVVGATFAGADWASGSISNQLLFESRRGRVWAAKALAVAIGTTVAALVVLVAFWAALAWLAASRDLPLPDGLLGGVAGDVGRALVLVAGGAVGGFAVSMLSRSTVATLAGVFVLSLASELLLAALPVAGRLRWSPATNVFAVLGDGETVFDPSLPCTSTTLECGFLEVTLLDGSLYLGVALAVVVALSVWSWRRRDVP